MRDVDSTVALVGRVQGTIPGTTFPLAPYGRWWASASKLAMGMPYASVRASLDTGVTIVDRLPGFAQGMAREQSLAVPYVAYAVTREPRYIAAVRRWRGDAPPWPELDALEALTRGDSARALELARGFPSTDSARTATGPMTAMRWLARAEVHQALGNARAAIANYEVLDPSRFSESGGVVDLAYPLWVRSYAARARLYASLGERDRAVASYERFIALWNDADAPLQPQVREARAAVVRLRDAAQGLEVKGGG
jgi:tetratricopeptide (TPR) repeat protein